MIHNKIEQLETRDAQIETEGEFKVQTNEVAVTDLSTQALQKLTVNELVDKWNQLEGDYHLFKWKLAQIISDNFKSKKEFGHFLQQLRITSPNHALCMIEQSTFYRYARAARFCDKFKISDLKEIGLSPTSIYSLSEIKNETVVDDIFVGNIKNKNLPVYEIKRLICQAHSITGELILSTESPEMDLPAQYFDNFEAINNEIQDLTEEHGESEQQMSSNSQPLVSCIELTNQLTEDQVQTVMKLLESFNLTSVKKVDDKKAYFNISRIEYGDPAQVTVCIKSDW